MGWTAGALQGAFTARAAIAFDLGEEFAARVIDTVRYGTVVYAAVRARDQKEIFALVLLVERKGGVLYTKPISEDEGPVEDRCPARILDLLTEPSNDYARQWRERCRARLARPRPRKGQTVVFTEAVTFTNEETHSTFTYQGGSRFRAENGCQCHIHCWQELEFTVTHWRTSPQLEPEKLPQSRASDR
ncbi:MAG: hypothetical protein H0X28_02720 [Solirubrobacterales bacterium]|nr:hypothetical protein [Solirubrobacterales bacterium]